MKSESFPFAPECFTKGNGGKVMAQMGTQLQTEVRRGTVNGEGAPWGNPSCAGT